MLQFLQSIDQFGAQQKLQIPPINPTQKSAFGGLVTLALYGISLGYFLFQFVDWQQNNKLPKVTSLQEQINEEQQLTLKGVFAEISYFKELTDQIDPFDPQNLIIQPILVSTNDYSNMTIIDATFQKKETINGKTINILYLENMQIQNSPISSVTRQYTNYQLTFGYCNPKFLKDEQNCADQHLIDKFFQQDTKQNPEVRKSNRDSKHINQLINFIEKIQIQIKKIIHEANKIESFFHINYNYFQIIIYLEQFDPRSKKVTKIPKIYVFDMIKTQLFQYWFILQAGELTMDDGFLFPNSNKSTYLYDMTLVSSQYDQEFSKKVYGEELISILYFNLDQVKVVNMVEYPKISEILADTGSIITWILSISFIVSRYNENLCLQNTSKKVISMYYPDFTDFQIKKDWLGKLKSINCKQKEFDPQKSEEILNKLEKIVNQKMNYLNLQNEVAKLQFILQAHLGIQKIKNYLEQNHKLELLFEKLQIPEKYSKQSINQINVENDLQFERASQIGGENDSKINKDLILDQEVESIMGLLDIKTAEIGQIKEQNNFIQIQESSLNLINYLKVNNFEKPVEKK